MFCLLGGVSMCDFARHEPWASFFGGIQGFRLPLGIEKGNKVLEIDRL